MILAQISPFATLVSLLQKHVRYVLLVRWRQKQLLFVDVESFETLSVVMFRSS